MDKFPATNNVPKLNHKEIENPNRPITSKKIESVIKNLPTNKNAGPEGLTGEFYQTFMIQYQSFSNYPKNRRGGNIFPTHFTRPVLPLYQKQKRPHNKRKIEAIIPDEH